MPLISSWEHFKRENKNSFEIPKELSSNEKEIFVFLFEKVRRAIEQREKTEFYMSEIPYTKKQMASLVEKKIITLHNYKSQTILILDPIFCTKEITCSFCNTKFYETVFFRTHQYKCPSCHNEQRIKGNIYSDYFQSLTSDTAEQIRKNEEFENQQKNHTKIMKIVDETLAKGNSIISTDACQICTTTDYIATKIWKGQITDEKGNPAEVFIADTINNDNYINNVNNNNDGNNSGKKALSFIRDENSNTTTEIQIRKKEDLQIYANKQLVPFRRKADILNARSTIKQNMMQDNLETAHEMQQNILQKYSDTTANLLKEYLFIGWKIKKTTTKDEEIKIFSTVKYGNLRLKEIEKDPRFSLLASGLKGQTLCEVKAAADELSKCEKIQKLYT